MLRKSICIISQIVKNAAICSPEIIWRTIYCFIADETRIYVRSGMTDYPQTAAAIAASNASKSPFSLLNLISTSWSPM